MRSENPSIYQTAAVRRRHRSARRIALRRGLVAIVVLLVLAALVGFAFGGSRTKLARGLEISGVDVSGLTRAQAAALLAARAGEVARVPVTLVAGGRSFRVSASQLGVEANWDAAVLSARAEGDGFGPVRGFRRLRTRVFGAGVTPPLTAYTSAVHYKLDKIAASVDRASVDARLERKGLRVTVVPARSGRRLDRTASADLIVRALGSLERGAAVTLPVVTTEPGVREGALAQAPRRAEIALSAPLHLVHGETRWMLPRWRIAALLDLPSGGETGVALAGSGAEGYMERLARVVGREPRDARFQVTAGGTIEVVPSSPGRELDMPATLRALTTAAFSPAERTAQLAVRVTAPQRTTAAARAMGITGVVGSYTTTYGGTPGRVHNVRLVAGLIDGTLIAPGKTFSFNETTGERNAEKGFAAAPVIINGELQNGIGGGVCQVSTTVFNAAFEAGLRIDRRTNHALYISHYPLGRDATVNYPDLDLRFTNDTDKWLLLRTFVGSGSLTVNLYGAPLDRRVETETSPLAVTGEVPVKKVDDPRLRRGKRIVEEAGAPPRETSVHRTVFAADGSLLHDDVWRSSYVGEPSIVRVGTKKPAKPPKPATADPGAVTAPPGEPIGSEPLLPGQTGPAPAPTLP